MRHPFTCAALFLVASTASAADVPATIRCRAQVNDEIFACGKHFDGLGVAKSKISGHDFRFCVSSVRLLDAAAGASSAALTLLAQDPAQVSGFVYDHSEAEVPGVALSIPGSGTGAAFGAPQTAGAIGITAAAKV